MGSARHQALSRHVSKDNYYKEQQRRELHDGSTPNMLAKEPNYHWTAPMLVMSFIWPKRTNGENRSFFDQLHNTRPFKVINGNESTEES